MAGLLVFGDINVDILGRLEKFTGIGGDNLMPALEQHCGGVGANTALALARWGVPVRLLGCVGRDAFGDLALDCIARAGIDVSFVERTDRALTGLMFIPIGPDGERTIFGCRGANAEPPTPGAGWQCLDGIAGLHLVGYNFLSRGVASYAERLVAEAMKRGIWISLDVGMAPGQQVPETILSVARNVDVLFASRSEAEALAGHAGTQEALAALESCGARESIVKLGEQGCLIHEDREWQQVPPFPVTAIDTTGSGDAFDAAFLFARLRDWPAPRAALLANAAGAAAAAVLGAGERLPGPEAIFGVLTGTRFPGPWESVRAEALQVLREEFKYPAAAGSLGGHRAASA